MKKVMLTIASLLFVSVLVNAQISSDSTNAGQQPPSMEGQPPVSNDQAPVPDDQSNYTRDMELIQSADVPASLRSTLQGSEYSGWEDGKLYRNASTNEYLIVIGEDDAKVFRFDANGTRIEDQPSDSNTSGAAPGSTDSGTPTAPESQTPTTPESGTPTTPNSGTPTTPEK